MAADTTSTASAGTTGSAGATTSVAALSDTQRRVLITVKRLGEATADELALALDISASAVRQHLGVLRAAALVETRQERGGQGRPADRFHATARSDVVFAAADGDMSVELLGDLEAEDPALIDKVFARRRRRLVETARSEVVGLPIGQQVDVVARLLDDQGYLTDTEQVGPDRYLINLRNCPIWSIAERFGQACSNELELIRDLIPGAAVERVSTKTAGAHTCAYEIAARPAVAASGDAAPSST